MRGSPADPPHQPATLRGLIRACAPETRCMFSLWTAALPCRLAAVGTFEVSTRHLRTLRSDDCDEPRWLAPFAFLPALPRLRTRAVPPLRADRFREFDWYFENSESCPSGGWTPMSRRVNPVGAMSLSTAFAALTVACGSSAIMPSTPLNPATNSTVSTPPTVVPASVVSSGSGSWSSCSSTSRGPGRSCQLLGSVQNVGAGCAGTDAAHPVGPRRSAPPAPASDARETESRDAEGEAQVTS